MSIQFIPLGIPLSSSFTMKSKYTLSTLPDGFPVSAAFAEFAINNVGPSGSNAVTITGSLVTKII